MDSKRHLWLYGALLVFLGYGFPLCGIAQQATPLSFSAALLEAESGKEQAPLTIPQQQAKKLASILSSQQRTPTTPTRKTPLRVIAEQAILLGRRTIIPLFTSSHLEGRLVGGRQTFTSPTDHMTAVAKEDARRPLFLPASQTFMVLEILSK